MMIYDHLLQEGKIYILHWEILQLLVKFLLDSMCIPGFYEHF